MRHTLKNLVADDREVLVVQDGMELDVEVQVTVGQETVTADPIDGLVDATVDIEQQTACNGGNFF